MALERLDPIEQDNIFLLDHYARYIFASSYVKGARVLDIACGYGYGSQLLAIAGASEVIGVDISNDAISYARNKYAHPQVTYYQGDITNLTTEDYGIFDVIVSFETLEHVENTAVAVESLKQILKPQGVFVTSVPNDIELGVSNPFHLAKFTHPEFINLLEHRFKKVVSLYQNYVAGSMVWRNTSAAYESNQNHKLPLIPHKVDVYSQGLEEDDSQRADCFLAVCSDGAYEAEKPLVVQSARVWRQHTNALVADRDRLWQEVQVWNAEAQNAQAQLENLTADRNRLWQEVQMWHTEAQTVTADRDRLWQEVQMWHTEAQNAQVQLAELATEKVHLGEEKRRLESLLAVSQSKNLALQQEVEELRLVRDELVALKSSRLHRGVERIRKNVLFRKSRSAARRLYQPLHTVTNGSTPAQRLHNETTHGSNVTIQAAGEQNPSSGGCEVWLLDVLQDEARALSWEEMQIGDGWQQLPNERSTQGNALVAMQKASMSVPLAEGGGMLRFLSHPWSGIATVEWDGTVQKLDLYSPIPEVKTVRLTPAPVLPELAQKHPVAAKHQRYGESTQRWIEMIQHDRPAAVAVMHPDWRGVRSASENLFSYRYYQDDTLDEESARQKARLLADAGVERVVLCGFPYTYRHLVRAIKKETPSTQIFVFWLSNFLQSGEDYSWTMFKQIDQLVRQGLISKWGFAKQGMAEIVGRTGVATGFLASCVRTIPDGPSIPQLGGPHLGLWAIEPIWRKLPYAMLAAASMIPEAQVHCTGQNERASEFAAYFKLKADIRRRPIDQADMPSALAAMHLNLYVTLSECSPMLPLESLAAGVPCLFGPTSHLFEDEPYLHSRLVVPYPDRAFVIAKYIEQALVEREQIISAYRAYAPEYNARARQSVRDFLEVGVDAVI